MISAEVSSESLLSGSPYVSYAYSYPHKLAYRTLPKPRSLAELWAGEDCSRLFLYVHLPFCEYRCGFCNLFTQSQPGAELPARYLKQLRIHADRVRAALTDPQFVRLAIGGGTPTYLNEPELAELCDILTAGMGARPREIPVSCEASPATVTPGKLALLREFGVDRLSLGVQSFDDSESKRLGRPQRVKETEAALEMIRAAGFPTLNIDLIYGGAEQSVADWVRSVSRAIEYGAEEIYLYPLYVRPLTGLARARGSWDDLRLAAYRAGRDRLLDAGYEQLSMRMFRAPHAVEADGPVYCCQQDGMVGLGCGARSYTAGLHYSNEFAVSRGGVRAILAKYLEQEPAWFDAAHHGVELTIAEQQRRFVILSLLQREGLSLSAFRSRWDVDAFAVLPELTQLSEWGLASEERGSLCLTAAGMERSDAIGPWLYSPEMRQRMESGECH